MYTLLESAALFAAGAGVMYAITATRAVVKGSDSILRLVEDEDDRMNREVEARLSDGKASLKEVHDYVAECRKTLTELRSTRSKLTVALSDADAGVKRADGTVADPQGVRDSLYEIQESIAEVAEELHKATGNAPTEVAAEYFNLCALGKVLGHPDHEHCEDTGYNPLEAGLGNAPCSDAEN